MTSRSRTVLILAIAAVVVAVGLVWVLRSPHPRSSDELHDILTLQNNQISSFDPLDGPALWSAKLRDGLIAEWRVYLDSPENRDS